MQGSGGPEWPSKLATNSQQWGMGASLIILVTDCLQNWNSFENGFLKTQNFFFSFWKGTPSLREDYKGMFIS